MQFTRVDPPDELKSLVECYWIVESNNVTPSLQKIIPDGFPELIFHFGAPYRIKLDKEWELQADTLVAGQITKFFFLENTGASDILGVKLKPAALTQLFDIDMSVLTDKVEVISETMNEKLMTLIHSIRKAESHSDRIKLLNEKIGELISEKINPQIEKAIDLIHRSNGTISVTALCEQSNLNERQAERLFKKCIGLSPKFYARIIRFSTIFQVAKSKKLSWSEVGLETGFYDQAHFIKDFKAFSGEDPSHYFFDEPTLANFFLKKV